jgi:hypothetical protein
VWHVSISWREPGVSLTALRARALAEEELRGVGDSTLGEWFEEGDLAWHLRRRLRAEEAAFVGPVLDVRKTWEATKRCNAIKRYLPAHVQRIPMEQWP